MSRSSPNRAFAAARPAALSFALAAAAAAAAATGCSALPAQSRGELDVGRLSFLREGVTTRDQVLSLMKTPRWEFEGGRILTYRVVHTEVLGNLTQTVPRRAAWWSTDGPDEVWEPTYGVVLVFDAAGVLRKYGVVPMK
jgi:hypothetical protein